MISDRNTIVAKSLQDFFSIIDPLTPKNIDCPFFKIGEFNPEEVLWFRGHSNLSWTLQPTIYRKVGDRKDKG